MLWSNIWFYTHTLFLKLGIIFRKILQLFFFSFGSFCRSVELLIYQSGQKFTFEILIKLHVRQNEMDMRFKIQTQSVNINDWSSSGYIIFLHDSFWRNVHIQSASYNRRYRMRITFSTHSPYVIWKNNEKCTLLWLNYIIYEL